MLNISGRLSAADLTLEAAVCTAGVWGVMGAYNRVGGTYCCEHPWLLNRVLKQEWGFDGVVVSDWFATHSTGAVAAGLDLEMPGPARFLGERLVEAVARGQVDQNAVAEAAGRVLRLVERAGKSTSSPRKGGDTFGDCTAGPAAARPTPPGESASDVARAAAEEGIVLLRNAGDVLPLNAAQRIAVIGPYADRLAVQGGGSAEVSPTYISSPLEAIRARGREVVYEPGCGLPGPTPLLDYRWLPDGLHLQLAGAPPETITRSTVRVPRGDGGGQVAGEFVPDRSGAWQFGLASAGPSRLLLDDQILIDNSGATRPDTFFRQGSHEATTEVELVAGSRHRLLAEFRVDADVPLPGVRIGARPLPPADARRRAVEAARAAEVVLVVVGYDSSWECAGADRPHLDLPGDQDEFIRAVAAANPRTVVVLNAGAPVSMLWADEVAAIVQVWFPGMEGGNALAAVLFGEVDASGRLPTTFPRRLEDSPVYPGLNYPGEDGVVRYAEGLLVGYRGYEARQVEPRFCFGHGLSYTRFAYANLRVDGQCVSLEVTNTGERPGVEVVQVYVRKVGHAYKQLVDFAKLRLARGETQAVRFELPERAFARWDSGWVVEAGDYEILVASSSRDVRAAQTLSRPT
jgi:beta-glucosidase